MDAQKEALRRVISTLANKDEELRCFLDAVDVTRTGLQEESRGVTSQLEAELEELRCALEERGARLRDVIREETRRKEAELQRQRSEAAAALLSCRDLLGFANQALSIADEDEFLTAAKQIKERVTMAPAFRMSTRPAASENMARFTVDFSGEKAGLLRLDFLPVPRAPEIDVSGCVVRDNSITVAWRPGGGGHDGPIESYDVEHRKANGGGWERIGGVTDTRVTLSGLRFDSPSVAVRVRARNRAAAGDFSEPVSLETKAFTFGFDAATAHADLRIHGDTVTWEPQGVKGHDARLRGKESKNSRSATPSPNKTAAGRGAGRERFAGESYTVLGTLTRPSGPREAFILAGSQLLSPRCPGDQEISGGRHYWELRPLQGWKSLSVGVAYRGGLGRFDQLGRSSASWCLSAGQWLQSVMAAKHGNRAKSLEPPPPRRLGVYCDHDNGQLMFVDVDQIHLLHVFRSRFLQPLVPAFTVWGGGISVATGLQVPSFMDNFLSSNHSAAADQTL